LAGVPLLPDFSQELSSIGIDRAAVARTFRSARTGPCRPRRLPCSCSTPVPPVRLACGQLAPWWSGPTDRSSGDGPASTTLPRRVPTAGKEAAWSANHMRLDRCKRG